MQQPGRHLGQGWGWGWGWGVGIKGTVSRRRTGQAQGEQRLCWGDTTVRTCTLRWTKVHTRLSEPQQRMMRAPKGKNRPQLKPIRMPWNHRVSRAWGQAMPAAGHHTGRQQPGRGQVLGAGPMVCVCRGHGGASASGRVGWGGRVWGGRTWGGRAWGGGRRKCQGGVGGGGGGRGQRVLSWRHTT